MAPMKLTKLTLRLRKMRRGVRQNAQYALCRFLLPGKIPIEKPPLPILGESWSSLKDEISAPARTDDILVP